MTVTRLKFGIPGIFLGLFAGVGLLLISNTVFTTGLAAIVILSLIVGVLRNQKPPPNWHIVAGGFVFGYGSIYALQICLAPFVQ